MLVLVLVLVSEINAISGFGFLLTLDNEDNEVHFYQMT